MGADWRRLSRRRDRLLAGFNDVMLYATDSIRSLGRMLASTALTPKFPAGLVSLVELCGNAGDVVCARSEEF